MRTHLSRYIVLLGSIVVVGCTIVLLTGAATDESAQLSLVNMNSRLLDLEKRVITLDKRLKTLEQKVGVVAPNEPAILPVIEILSPQNGEGVSMNVIVEGIVRVDDLEGRFPVIAVHPILTNLIWIQPLPVTVEKTLHGCKFRCRACCGTETQGKGEQFELYALLPQKGTLKEGDVLDKLPNNVPVSPSVLVTRSRD